MVNVRNLFLHSYNFQRNFGQRGWVGPQGSVYGYSLIVDLFCDPAGRPEGGEVSQPQKVDGVYRANWKLKQICNKPTKTTNSPVVHQKHE
ncbi:hypothetical protein PROFUN_07134 [Planoprotostelium fungivorum]|uniref:Uncharacterized protein n=1 Tax=Planoprotostelium fungivorum TaxID=1890364 RepID=A0A2P6NML1_9EUKA|nr:hypothetical protein PROFUN_07134 [Planoprotostelium fungivorum]